MDEKYAVSRTTNAMVTEDGRSHGLSRVQSNNACQPVPLVACLTVVIENRLSVLRNQPTRSHKEGKSYDVDIKNSYYPLNTIDWHNLPDKH